MKLFLFITALALTSIKSSAQEKGLNHLNVNRMKEFSLLVRVPVNYTTEQVKVVGKQWDKLLEKWKAENVYVISFAFPGESYVVSGNSKVVSKESVMSINRRVVSNIVLRAANIEQAILLAKDCPVLEHDGSIEIREIPAGVPPRN